MLSKIAIASGLIGTASADWNFGWNCPLVYPKMDLDTSLFAGKWYEIYRD